MWLWTSWKGLFKIPYENKIRYEFWNLVEFLAFFRFGDLKVLLWMLWGILAFGRRRFGISGYPGKISYSDLDPRDFKIFRVFHIPIPGIWEFQTQVFVGIFNSRSRSPRFLGFFELAQSGFGISKKSHPEANFEALENLYVSALCSRLTCNFVLFILFS